MIPPNPQRGAVARTYPPRQYERGRTPRTWLIATGAVFFVWLLGSLVDRTGVAFGSTVPAAPQVVSDPANFVAKRRPQLASDPVSGGVYLVWEQGTTGTSGTNSNSNLYYAYRSPVTGNWTVPSLVVDPATVNYGGRWGTVLGSPVNETHAHIQVDSAGSLHVVFSAWRSGSVGFGAYYTVAQSVTAGAPNWTVPVRLDKTSYAPSVDGYLMNSDNTRLFVRDDPSGAVGAKVGYVLWTGNDGNQLRLTRVGYGPAHAAVSLLDTAPLTNPKDTRAGPVAVLELDNATLQLVYAGTSLDSGDGIWGAPLQLNGGAAPYWGDPGPPAVPSYRTALAGNNGNDCNVTLCTGATAVRDDLGNTWIAANYDKEGAHAIQATLHDGTPSATPLGVDEFFDTPKAGRQPVVVFEQNPPTSTAVVVYNQCTYVSTSSCTGKDIYYRVYEAGAWGPANLTGLTSGDQQDLTAVMVTDDLLYAWVGVNQTGSATPTGQHVYFHGVQSP